MRNSRRNIPDPVSPQNPVIAKDVIDQDRVQNHLKEKTSVEDTVAPGNTTKEKKQTNKVPYKNGNDSNFEDES